MDAETFTLETGRARAISTEVLLVMVVVDGVYSLTSLEGYERLVGSEVFQAVLGGRRTPARSTVAKYLGLVSAESHALLHRTLLRMVRAEGLDTFEELTVDSTAIAANTAWPTESALIVGFLNRIHRLLERQAKYTQVAYSSKLVERWLKELARLHRSINLLPSRPGSVAKRRKLYGKLLTVADKTRKKLEHLFATRWEEITSCCIRPTFRLRVDRMLEQIEADFAEAAKAAEAARRRVLQDECVAASGKTFSLADPDAYMILKGQRDPVVGYKPQLGRSGNGFISCLELLRGNPADSERLAPMLAAHIEATGTCPAAVSTDDGYSSAANLDALCTAGVEVISFSGAKGRKVLGDELYELDASILLRSERSAVESLIFTFKHKFGMRRFCRRGLAGARKDLSAAVLAYNLWRTAFVRKAKGREPDDPPIRAVA
ncbi:MAG: transposase [Planctomycetes bacterium]|nr:transposase [Planctomycetota bacterium]